MSDDWIRTSTTIPSPVITTTLGVPMSPVPDVYEEALRRILRGEIQTYPARVVMNFGYIGRHRA